MTEVPQEVLQGAQDQGEVASTNQGTQQETHLERVAQNVSTKNASTGVYDFYKSNPYTIANHHALLSGQFLALLIGRGNLYNANPLSMIGYSLGTNFVFDTCVLMHDLGCVGSLGDIVLMGCCVDLVTFGQNLHKLIGSKGCIQGTLTVMYSMYDSVLAYLFKSIRLGEYPIGYKRMSKEYLTDCLIEHDQAFKAKSRQQVKNYLDTRLINVDMSEFVDSHFVFKYRVRRMLPYLKFVGDHKGWRGQGPQGR